MEELFESHISVYIHVGKRLPPLAVMVVRCWVKSRRRNINKKYYLNLSQLDYGMVIHNHVSCIQLVKMIHLVPNMTCIGLQERKLRAHRVLQFISAEVGEIQSNRHLIYYTIYIN